MRAGEGADPADRRPGDYIQINSGLGESTPLNIIVLPILFEGSVRAVVELRVVRHLQPYPSGLP